MIQIKYTLDTRFLLAKYAYEITSQRETDGKGQQKKQSVRLNVSLQKQSPIGCSEKKLFLEISQNLQENTCEFCEISKNTFFSRKHPVAASLPLQQRKHSDLFMGLLQISLVILNKVKGALSGLRQFLTFRLDLRDNFNFKIYDVTT